MNSINDPYCADDLYRPASEGRSLHDDACHFYQKAMGLSTPLVDLPVLEVVVKVVRLVTSSTNDRRSSSMIHDLRDTVASVLWPDGVAPHTKEGLLWTAANYDQKKRNAPVSDDGNDKNKKEKNEKKEHCCGRKGYYE